MLGILNDSKKLIEVVTDELKEIQENYKDERRIEIQDSSADLSAEDLTTPEDRAVTISHEGYAKLSRWKNIELKEEENRENSSFSKR